MKAKEWLRERKQNLENKFWNTSNKIRVWWSYNKEWAVVVIPSVTMGAAWIGKKLINGAIMSHNLNKEKMLKERYVYDRSLGDYWKLKRSMSTSEMLEVEARREEGEKLGSILKSMRLI